MNTQNASSPIHTTTTKAPRVCMDTKVSVSIGSDQYAAKIVRLTASTVTVTCRCSSGELTFRPYESKSAKRYIGGEWVALTGWRADRSYFLVVGEDETKLDPSF